jgi:hypothetical protein
MPDFVVSHTPGWLDYFGRQGHVPTALAAGVEGAIYDLGDGLVAKVWRDRPVPELERMQRFYADVASASLPFATPEIRRIDQVNGMSVTYERKLPGQPLQRRLDITHRDLSPAAVECVTGVLHALAAVPATASMRELAALDESRPLWEGTDRFKDALLGLIERRTARFGPAIRDHSADVLLTYQAAYAVVTSSAFTPDGSDGHFAWCIAQLRRADVSEAKVFDARAGQSTDEFGAGGPSVLP